MLESAEEEEVEVAEEEEVEGAGLEDVEGAEDGPCRLCAIPGAGFAWPCFLMLQDEGWGWFCPPGGAGRLDGCGGRFDEGGNRFGSGKPG